jgi:hypothetical protein
MSKEKDTPPFHASAKGDLTASGAWVISPRLWFRDDLSTAEREAVQEDARTELLGSVLEEALRGKRLGAERVQVALDNGERLPVVGSAEPPIKKEG